MQNTGKNTQQLLDTRQIFEVPYVPYDQHSNTGNRKNTKWIKKKLQKGQIENTKWTNQTNMKWTNQENTNS